MRVTDPALCFRPVQGGADVGPVADAILARKARTHGGPRWRDNQQAGNDQRRDRPPCETTHFCLPIFRAGVRPVRVSV